MFEILVYIILFLDPIHLLSLVFLLATVIIHPQNCKNNSVKILELKTILQGKGF